MLLMMGNAIIVDVTEASTDPGPFMVSLLLLLALHAVVIAPAVVISLEIKKRREVRKGYTTLTNQFGHVDQIDPKTHRIVRLAGEDLLMREEYLERIKLIRSEESPDAANG